MSNAKVADLCQYDLPNGKLCRQVALKGEQACRHHMRLFRHNMSEVMHAEALERFTAELGQMNLRDLLITVVRKLKRIEKTIPAWDEARVAVHFAVNALQQKDDLARVAGFARELERRAQQCSPSG
jgi:hypothetical protein